jgi:2-methylcitrate dehydratase PrpD
MGQMALADSGATRALARHTLAVRYEEIPARVVHEAKRALLNYFAVALAGCSDPAVIKTATVLRQFRANNAASVVGRRCRTDILGAAMLNAMSANVFDFDDTHIPTIIHPTGPVAAALLALSERATLSGRDFLAALVLGIDVECRIGNAVSPLHYGRGWHITSTCGPFGAAAAVGRILGLTQDQMVWGLGHASAQAAGLVETLGYMSKSISVGNAARNGLLAALLAQEGLSGPESPIEGPRGFVRVTCDRPDMDALTRELGQRWELMANTYKPYPCGVVLNPVIEACLALAADPAVKVGDIASITLTGHPLLRQRTDRPRPRSGREAQVSGQHAVAVTLTTGRAGLAQFSDERIGDAALLQLGDKVCFVDDDTWDVEGARVTLRFTSGAEVTRSIAQHQGSLAKPLTDAQIADKLRALAAYGGSGVEGERLIDAVWSMENADDVSVLMRLACPDGP